MKWCNHYNCWCDDSQDITDGLGDCDYDCKNCEEAEEVKPQHSGGDIFERM